MSVKDVETKIAERRGEIQIVTFSLGKEHYCVVIDKVKEIIRVPEITEIPRAPVFIEGLINLRGNVVSVIDLRKFFKIEPSIKNNEEDLTRIIIADLDNLALGLIVDSVWEVVRVRSDQIDKVSSALTSINNDFIDGVCKISVYDENGENKVDKLVLLLNLERILNTEELKRLESNGRQENSDRDVKEGANNNNEDAKNKSKSATEKLVA